MTALPEQHVMLAGLKILDFTSLLPGPYATMILGDLGAEVLRVENPGRDDLVNMLEPATGEKSGVFTHLNRNKTFIELDLQNEQDRVRIHELIQEYDIIVEGFRPGAMERLDLDYSTLRNHNPSIIYASLSGYGQTGPLANRAGHDINYLALSGLASLIGSPQKGPILPGLQLADMAGSLYTVIALLVAHIHRTKTGDGQYIDISILECSMSLAPLQFPRQLLAGDTPSYADHILSGATYYNYYRTQDDQFLAIGGLESKFFNLLCQAIGIDPDPEGRFTNGKISAQIREIVKSRSLNEWMSTFEGLDACVDPVLSLEEVLSHPQTRARNTIVPVKIHGTAQQQLSHPIKYSKYDPQYEYHDDV